MGGNLLFEALIVSPEACHVIDLNHVPAAVTGMPKRIVIFVVWTVIAFPTRCIQQFINSDEVCPGRILNDEVERATLEVAAGTFDYSSVVRGLAGKFHWILLCPEPPGRGCDVHTLCLQYAVLFRQPGK